MLILVLESHLIALLLCIYNQECNGYELMYISPADYNKASLDRVFFNKYLYLNNWILLTLIKSKPYRAGPRK